MPVDEPQGGAELVAIVRDEAAMLALAGDTARSCRRFRVVYLLGELGAGKTTWVRGFLRALGVHDRVRSPTFTLVEPYDTEWGIVHHFDLYRLADPEEVEYLGIRDMLGMDGCLLFEWPERGAGHLPPPDLTVEIEHLPEGRRVRMRSADEALRRAVADAVGLHCS